VTQIIGAQGDFGFAPWQIHLFGQDRAIAQMQMQARRAAGGHQCAERRVFAHIGFAHDPQRFRVGQHLWRKGPHPGFPARQRRAHAIRNAQTC
jgi:hypothetical protein